MYICPIMIAIIHRHVIKLFLLDSCLSKMHAVESLVWTCYHCYWLWQSHMLSLFFLCRDEGSMLYSVFLCAALVSDHPTSFSTSVLFSLYFECSWFIHYCDIFYDYFLQYICVAHFTGCFWSKLLYNAMHGCYSEC